MSESSVAALERLEAVGRSMPNEAAALCRLVELVETLRGRCPTDEKREGSAATEVRDELAALRARKAG